MATTTGRGHRIAMQALKPLIHRLVNAVGYRIVRNRPAVFDNDGLQVYGKYAPFLQDERFMRAYQLGASSGHHQGELHIEWRVAVSCWAAAHGAKLPGDFVECGVNTGFHSLAICEYLDFNSIGKRFYLFDTFCGIPEEQMSPAERPKARSKYLDCFEAARKNFARFPGAVLVRGKVPDTLPAVQIDKVAYLSIDMNIAYPESKAIEYFWPKLVPGAIVLLDDYGWHGYEEQRATMDEFARVTGIEILALPTGQGLLLKP